MKRRALGIIFAIVLLDLLGFGIIIPQLGVYAKYFQASAFVQALLVASYSVAQFLGAPLLGRWSDVVGRKKILALSLLAGMGGHLLFALAHSMRLLFASRIVAGIGAANVSTAQAYIGDVTESKDRARAMGLVGAAFGLGFVFGPAIGGIAGKIGTAQWGTHGGNLLIGLAAASLSLVTLSLTLFVLPESRPSAVPPEQARPLRLLDTRSLAEALRTPVLGRLLVIFLVSTSGFTVLHAILTYFVIDSLGVQVTGAAGVERGQMVAGEVFAWIGLLSALIQGGGVGPLAKRYGEARLLFVGLGLMTVGLVTLPTAESMVMLLALLVPLSVGQALCSATTPALITFHSREAQRGEILGVSQSLGAIGRIIGPLAGGWLYDRGIPVPFLVGAVLTGLAMVLARRLPMGHPADQPLPEVVEEAQEAAS